MQLPENLHPFEQTTFIVVTDSVQAKLFKALDRDVELVHVISTKLEPMEQERSQIVTGAGDSRSGDAHESNKKWAREQLYEQLNKDLMHRHQNGEFEALAFTVPEEHVNDLKESLHTDLLKIADVWVPKNLTNDELEDIVMHVQEES